jgi:outer membrane receptor protein involved in Fe transport
LKKTKLVSSIALAIGASVLATSANAQLEEIVVTATKRAESAQDIPVAIQAISSEALDELGVNTFDEYVKYLPNVVQQGRGPGRNEIYIRGVATEQSSNTVSSVQGSAPAVALYLDDQAVSFGGRNLDIYAADLQRVEVLPGPQGTLFGASSQSGTVRLITNKPSTQGFEASVKAGYSSTSGGDPSTNLEAAFNFPLSDTMAARAVVYSDTQGGWIDNVAAAFNPNKQDLINVINRNQISSAAAILPGSPVAQTTNGNLIQDNWNDAQYQGVRLGFSWDINQDWSALVQHTSQDLETEGVFEYAPTTGSTNQSQSFSPDRNNDNFGLTTLTVEGRVGGLDVIYTGGFLDRDVSSVIDYTVYSFGGGYQVYYITTGGYSTASEVFDLRKQYVDDTESERTSHEFRIQGEIGERFQYTVGAFFDDVETKSLGQFQYFGALDAGLNTAVRPADFARGSNSRIGLPEQTTFANDFTREEEQTAFFADVSFELTDSLTVSAGVRAYDIDYALTGATGGSFGCKGKDPASLQNGDGVVPSGRDISYAVTRADGTIGCSDNSGNNVTQRLINLGTFGALSEGGTPVSGLENLGADGVANQDDTIFRFTADWKATDDILLFATVSEGFRPQTVNRNAGSPSANQTGPFEGFVVPAVAKTDELTNFEIGIKGDFLSNRLRLNATYFNSEITDLQTTRFDPSNVAFLVFIENVGDADIQGIDADFTWVPTDNLTIAGAASWVDSEITRLNAQLEGLAAPVGSELPFTAEFGFNVRGRYEFEMDNFGGDAFVQAGLVYTGDSLSGIVGNANFVEDTTRRIYGRGSGLQIRNEGGTFGASGVATEVPGSTGLTADGQFFANGRYVQESYSIVNVSTGVNKDNWGVELFVNNLFDEDGIININTADYTPRVSVTRPRTVGLRFRWDYQ